MSPPAAPVTQAPSALPTVSAFLVTGCLWQGTLSVLFASGKLRLFWHHHGIQRFPFLHGSMPTRSPTAIGFTPFKERPSVLYRLCPRSNALPTPRERCPGAASASRQQRDGAGLYEARLSFWSLSLLPQALTPPFTTSSLGPGHAGYSGTISATSAAPFYSGSCQPVACPADSTGKLRSLPLAAAAALVASDTVVPRAGNGAVLSCPDSMAFLPASLEEEPTCRAAACAMPVTRLGVGFFGRGSAEFNHRAAVICLMKLVTNRAWPRIQGGQDHRVFAFWAKSPFECGYEEVPLGMKI